MREVLQKVARGELSIEEAERKLRLLALRHVEEAARLDVGRELRRGIPEIVLAEGKSNNDLVKIVKDVLKDVARVIVSRLTHEQMAILRDALGEGFEVRVNEKARVLVARRTGGKIRKTGGKVGILTGGTADVSIAEEARIVAEEMGCEVLTAYDVGVAGIHRVFDPLKKMLDEGVDVLVVVAGMEGALPSVVATLVDVPVVGVPASRGYGIGGKGVGALISMLQSCPLGLTVVNIDNGVGAGAFAALVANRIAKYREPLPKERSA